MAVLDQFGRQIANINSMMARFGVDPRALASDLLGSAMHVCLDCPNDEVCHNWLARAAKLPRRAPKFCPNATVLTHALEIAPGVSPFARPSLNPSVTHGPRRDCQGSLKTVGWEGRLDDPRQPREIACPICGAKMKPALDAYAFHEFEDKNDIYWAFVPRHLPGKRPEYY